MQYEFLDQSDEKLLRLSDMPVDGGIAVAVRTTGYDVDLDEVLELAIVDLHGAELFHKVVKPQNVEAWAASDVTGELAPSDVADAPELFQFETEISDLFENASIVVAPHRGFLEDMIEQSWVTLPEFTGFDLIEEFRSSHSAVGYRGEPASAVALGGIVSYYDQGSLEGDALTEARLVAGCYQALIGEHVRKREEKGEAYWRRRDERLAEEAAKAHAGNVGAQMRERRLNQMNGLLWVAAAIIFASVIIQLQQNGGDIGFMVLCGAFAIFALIRAIAAFRK